VHIANCEGLLAVVYKPLDRAWSDADAINLLNLRTNPVLVDNLKAKNPVWSSQVSNPSGEKTLDPTY